MHSEWDDFLRNRTAATTADPSESSHWICPLPDTGVLAIGGKDSGRFLQGQTTCDILGLETGQTTLGALCNPKGRVIAVFRAFKSEDLIYLLLPRELTAAVEKRLRMYVLRADVKIENVSGEWLAFGIGGEKLVSPLDRLGITAPASINGVSCQPNCFAIHIPSNSAGRMLLVAGHEKAKALWVALEEKAHLVYTDPARWRLEDIRAGIPRIGQAMSEEFLPQMLNLDLLDGISFNKGCYTGQEIVARTHYLGSLKRRMYRLEVRSDEAPQAGELIFEAGRDEQSAGVALDSAPTAAACHEILAVLNITQAENGDLRLHGSHGLRLSLLSLPYSTTPTHREHRENGPQE